MTNTEPEMITTGGYLVYIARKVDELTSAPMDEGQVRDALTDWSSLENTVQQMRPILIALARAQGVTDAEIGRCLGISRQAVHQMQ